MESKEIKTLADVRNVGTLDFPLYVGKDVCKLLGRDLHFSDKKYLDKIDKTKMMVETLGRDHLHVVLTKTGLIKALAMVKPLKKKCKFKTCESNCEPNYEDYCKKCYRKIHPYTIIQLVKENSVAEALTSKISHPFVRNITVGSGISRKKPDIYFDFKEYGIIVEIDENQHYRLKDEDERMAELHSDIKKHLHIIRFNPDEYRSDGIFAPSCWRDGQIVDLALWNLRLAALVSLLEEIFKNPPTDGLKISYLYYDEFRKIKDEKKI